MQMRGEDMDPRAHLYSKDFNNMEGFDPSLSIFPIRPRNPTTKI